MHEPVVENDVGLRETLDRAHRQQTSIAGACTDQKDSGFDQGDATVGTLVRERRGFGAFGHGSSATIAVKALSISKEPLVFAVMADPEPDEAFGSVSRESAVMQAYPSGPIRSDFLKASDG